MEEQRARARASWKGGARSNREPRLPAICRRPTSKATGRLAPTTAKSSPSCRKRAGVGAQELKPGERGEVVLDHTPFYADSGGQVGDIGWLYARRPQHRVAEVDGCYYPVQGVRAHKVIAQAGPFTSAIKSMPSSTTKCAATTMRNHTGTHLLHAALREGARQAREAGRLAGRSRDTCASTSRTSPRSPTKNCRTSKTSSTRKFCATISVEVIEDVPIDVAVNEYKRDGAVRRKVWRQSSRDQASATSPPSSAAARTPRPPAKSA